MKKQLKLSILAILFSYMAIAQVTATTVANGNWTNPFTWNCTCVPLPGSNVVINHSVTLNTSFAYNSGTIIINSSGSLVQDANRDIWVNGGGFFNSGYADFRYFLTSSGSLNNNGTITVRSFSNNLSFTNTGILQNIDSMVNNATITNNGSFLSIDRIVNTGTFVNNQISLFNQFSNTGLYNNNKRLTFTDITNIGILTNNDSLFCLNSMWNQARITNTSPASIRVTKNLLNRKIPGGTASIVNEGLFKILDSYYNYDTIRGITGRFTVQDSSVNNGRMLGSFDFCDATPIPLPNIDFNFGTISPNITYCSTTGINEKVLGSNFKIYPNPAQNYLILESDTNEDCEIKIYSSDGKLHKTTREHRIDISELSSGLYLISIGTKSSVTEFKKIQIIK